jgi:hypothetical protein
MRLAALLPALGVAALAALGAGRVFAGHEAHIGHELAGAVEAQEVLQLGHQRHGGDQLYTAHGLQRLDQWLQAPLGQRVAQCLLQSCDSRIGLGDGVQILLEADLLRRVFKLERGQPAQMGGGPRTLADVSDAVAQEQRLQAMASVATLTNRVFPRTHQVAHGFVGRPRHAHRGEFARVSPTAVIEPPMFGVMEPATGG